MSRSIFVAVVVLITGFASHAVRAETFHTCAGFVDSVPATIATQGVWCLRRDLSTAIASGAAITVAANNVTLDCNDFKLGGLAAGPASQTRGIASTDRQNVAVRNCNIRGFHSGVSIQGGAGHLVEDSRFDNNLRYGIHVFASPDANSRVLRNAVYDTGGLTSATNAEGIYATANVIDNVVEGVFTDAAPSYPTGIVALGALARGNVVLRIVPLGGGSARGITGYLNVTAAEGNRVNGGTFNVPGIGIHSMQVCKDNMVSYFTSAFGSCGSAAGNLP